MKLKRDANFEEKLTIGSKNDTRNLVNFNASSGKSEQFHLIYIGAVSWKMVSKMAQVIGELSRKKLKVMLDKSSV